METYEDLNHCSILNAALHYFHAGWYVIPLQGKRPLQKNWPNHQMGMEELCEVFSTPGTNIGLPLGPINGLWALDVDGYEGMTELIRNYNEFEHEQPAFRTPNNGIRFLYTIRENQCPPTKQKKAGDREAYRILGQGSQTVLPPSNIEGRLYTWFPWPLDYMFTEPAPIRFAAYLNEMSNPLPIPQYKEPPHQTNAYRAMRYLLKADPAISGQGGHNQLFKICCKMFQLFHLDPDTALQLVATYYNPQCQPPWTNGELAHKITDAYRVYKNTTGSVA